MDRIDLDELEQLLNEDIDLDGETLETIGTQVMFSDGSKYAHAFAKNDDFWLASVRARIIAAAIKAVPSLIAKVRGLEKERFLIIHAIAGKYGRSEAVELQKFLEESKAKEAGE